MEKINIEEEINKLIDRVLVDFKKSISSETDLTTILLKGHLLIEYYLNYLIIINHDTDERIDKKSFYEKIKIIEKDNTLNKNHITCLYKLNNIRNDLSHKLNYSVLESEIDNVGFYLGKKYIFEKFDKDCNDPNQLKSLFIWVINKILFAIVLPVFKEIIKEKQKTLT